MKLASDFSEIGRGAEVNMCLEKPDSWQASASMILQAIGPEYRSISILQHLRLRLGGDAGYRPATYPDMVEKYQDNLSWVHGKHTIVVGADMQFTRTFGIMAPVSLNGIHQLQRAIFFACERNSRRG